MSLNEDNITPLWDWVLVKKDKDSHITKGGIQLPDGVAIPSLEVRILKMGKGCEFDCPENFINGIVQVGDRCIVHMSTDRQPVQLEDEQLMLVPSMCLIGKVELKRSKVTEGLAVEL